jgi:hypothetical protein
MSNHVHTQTVEPSGIPGETITLKPQPITIEGLSPKFKRNFEGWELWSRSDSDYESAVYLTVKNYIVYWNCVPRADSEELEIYDSLGDFLDGQNDWLDGKRGQQDKWAIMRAYVDLTGEELIEDLDI